MVIQRTVEKASPESIRALHAWLSHSSDFHSHVTVREPSPTHRALYATKRIPPFASILRIPASHLISSNLAHRTPVVTAVLSAVEADELHQRLPDALGDSAALVLFLMAELVAGQQSRYYPWFQTLPKSFTNPFTVPKNVVDALLEETPLLPLIDILREELKEMYDEWFVPYAVEKYPRQYPGDKCTWETFLYVHSIIESRAFKIDEETMLVPFADMANHQSGSSGLCNAKARGWSVAHSSADAQRIASGGTAHKGLELHAGEAGIEEGEEVCISYGALPNWELLLHYGFTMGRNADEFADIALQVPEDDAPQVYMTKMVFLGMETTPSLQVDHRLRRDDALPVSLVASTRLLCLDEEEAKHVSVRDTDFSKAISARNEQMVHATLEALLTQLRHKFRAHGAAQQRCQGHETLRKFCQHYVDLQREIINTALDALRTSARNPPHATPPHAQPT